jgi:hypothetical protein
MGKDFINPLITHDPVHGKELIVTRLESPEFGIVIEGNFSLGWIGRLTPAQLEFVGLLVKNRGNVQKLATERNIAYNTARNHLDEIVALLEESMGEAVSDLKAASKSYNVISRLSSGEISFNEALGLLQDS